MEGFTQIALVCWDAALPWLIAAAFLGVLNGLFDWDL